MPALLDDQQEALAQELAKGVVQATAWLNAGFSAKNNGSASAQCCKLLKKTPEISERIGELKALARDQVLTDEFKADMAGLTKAYLEDRAQAKALGQVSSAISALNSIAKMHGVLNDTVKHQGDPNNPVMFGEIIVRGVSAANR